MYIYIRKLVLFNVQIIAFAFAVTVFLATKSQARVVEGFYFTLLGDGVRIRMDSAH